MLTVQPELNLGTQPIPFPLILPVCFFEPCLALPLFCCLSDNINPLKLDHAMACICRLRACVCIDVVCNFGLQFLVCTFVASSVTLHASSPHLCVPLSPHGKHLAPSAERPRRRRHLSPQGRPRRRQIIAHTRPPASALPARSVAFRQQSTAAFSALCRISMRSRVAVPGGISM